MCMWWWELYFDHPNVDSFMETFNAMVDLKKREAVGTAQFMLGDSTSA